MDILILLVPMSLVLVALIGVVFAWSVKSGQYDDLEGPAHRILADDDGASASEGSAPDPDAGLTAVNLTAPAARNMHATADAKAGSSAAVRRLPR